MGSQRVRHAEGLLMEVHDPLKGPVWVLLSRLGENALRKERTADFA